MNDPPPPEGRQRRLGQSMVWGMWILVLLLLTLVFGHWEAGQRNPNRAVESRTLVDGGREVVLQRNRYHHYVAIGMINGVPVEFMLDTGASDISVPEPVAQRLGLRRGAPVRYQTANGVITGYATVLDAVRLGDIELRGVRASINPHMGGEEVLLGMSFLRHLEFTQRGDTLTLRQAPN